MFPQTHTYMYIIYAWSDGAPRKRDIYDCRRVNYLKREMKREKWVGR